MSEIDREELRGLLEESTPGPWLYDNQSGKTDEFELFYQDLSYSNGPDIASFKGREADAQLICLAPTLATAYLDLLERVEALENYEIHTPVGTITVKQSLNVRDWIKKGAPLDVPTLLAQSNKEG